MDNIFCSCKGNCLSTKGRAPCICRKNNQKCGAKCGCGRGRVLGCMNSDLGTVFVDDLGQQVLSKKRKKGNNKDKTKNTEAYTTNSTVTELQDSSKSALPENEMSSVSKTIVSKKVRVNKSKMRIKAKVPEQDAISCVRQVELNAPTNIPVYNVTCSNFPNEPTHENSSTVIMDYSTGGLPSHDSESRKLNCTLEEVCKEKEFDVIEVMTAKDLRSVLRYILAKNPLISLSSCMMELKLTGETEKDQTGASPEPNPGSDDDGNGRFCRCLNCIPMPTRAEQVCCATRINNGCITQAARFRDLGLDRDVLRIQMGLRFDLGGIVYDVSTKCYRHAAYRQYVAWQYGYLGKSNRRVVPACAVAVIRRTYPSPNGRYKGYVPPPPRRGVRNNQNN